MICSTLSLVALHFRLKLGIAATCLFRRCLLFFAFALFLSRGGVSGSVDALFTWGRTPRAVSASHDCWLSGFPLSLRSVFVVMTILGI